MNLNNLETYIFYPWNLKNNDQVLEIVNRGNSYSDKQGFELNFIIKCSVVIKFHK